MFKNTDLSLGLEMNKPQISWTKIFDETKADT